MRAFVYRNLNRGGFSIRDRSTGRVAAYAETVVLVGVRFRVQPAGRRRVLKERRKNVHAGAAGDLVGYTRRPLDPSDLEGAVEVTYDPYSAPTFVRVDGGDPVESATMAILSGGRCWAFDPTAPAPA